MSAAVDAKIAGHPPATKAGGMRVANPQSHGTALAKADEAATPKTNVEQVLTVGPAGAGKVIAVDPNGGALVGKLHGDPTTKATASTYHHPEAQHEHRAGGTKHNKKQNVGKVANFQPSQLPTH